MISATGSTDVDRRSRVDHDAGVAARVADHLQRVVDVRRRLGVHGDHVGAGLRERLDLPLGPLDHQVAVEDPAARVDEVADRLDDQRPDRDRRDEVPVHHVDVDHLRAGVHHELDLLGELREVAGEERRRDLAARNRSALTRAPRRPRGPRARRRTRGTARPPAAAARSPSAGRTTPAAAARRAPDLGERAGGELVLDGDARLERQPEPEPHGLLDRAVRAERQRLRPQVVVGEELGDELARARARLAHQPDPLGELLGPHRPARPRARRRARRSARSRSRGTRARRSARPRAAGRRSRRRPRARARCRRPRRGSRPRARG